MCVHTHTHAHAHICVNTLLDDNVPPKTINCLTNPPMPGMGNLFQVVGQEGPISNSILYTSVEHTHTHMRAHTHLHNLELHSKYVSPHPQVYSHSSSKPLVFAADRDGYRKPSLDKMPRSADTAYLCPST